MAKRDENTCRKDYAWTEAVANGEAIEALERPEAKNRKAHGGRAGKLPTRSRVRDKVAAAVGKKPRSYDKARAVVAAAKAEPVGGGGIVGPYKRLIVMRKAEAIRCEPPPLSEHGPYRVIAAACARKFEGARQAPHAGAPRFVTPWPRQARETASGGCHVVARP